MERFVNLLVVQDGNERRVVSIENCYVVPGDLVEYVLRNREETEEPEVGFRWETPEKTRLGLVLKKMECELFRNEWSLVAELATIHKGKAVYRCIWAGEAEDRE